MINNLPPEVEQAIVSDMMYYRSLRQLVHYSQAKAKNVRYIARKYKVSVHK